MKLPFFKTNILVCLKIFAILRSFYRKGLQGQTAAYLDICPALSCSSEINSRKGVRTGRGTWVGPSKECCVSQRIFNIQSSFNVCIAVLHLELNLKTNNYQFVSWSFYNKILSKFTPLGCKSIESTKYFHLYIFVYDYVHR